MKKRISRGLMVLFAAWLTLPVSCGDPAKLYAKLDAGERPANARSRLEKLAGREPVDPRALSWLAIVCAEQGDLGAAGQALEKLQAQAPGSYEALTAECTVNAATADWRKALVSCKAALEASERSARDLNLAAAADLKAGLTDAARALLDEGLKKFPNDRKLRINQGYLLLQTGKYDEAVAIFKVIADQDPSNVTVRKDLANALFQKQDPAGAARELEGIVAEYPDDVEALTNLAIIYGSYKVDAAKAKTYAEKVLALKPNHPQAALLKDIAAGKVGKTPMMLPAAGSSFERSSQRERTPGPISPD